MGKAMARSLREKSGDNSDTGRKSKKQNAQATRTHSQQKYACPS
jgi:hypothetical protein